MSRVLMIFQLAGLAVIRAFNQQPVFQHRLQSSLDNQNVSMAY